MNTSFRYKAQYTTYIVYIKSHHFIRSCTIREYIYTINHSVDCHNGLVAMTK